MTKRRKQGDSRTSAESRTPEPEPEITLDDLARALQELAIPAYYHARLVGNRLEIHAYGGQVRTWPAAQEE